MLALVEGRRHLGGGARRHPGRPVVAAHGPAGLAQETARQLRRAVALVERAPGLRHQPVAAQHGPRQHGAVRHLARELALRVEHHDGVVVAVGSEQAHVAQVALARIVGQLERALGDRLDAEALGRALERGVQQAVAGSGPCSTSGRLHLRCTSSCAIASICIAWLGRVCSRCGAHCAARRASSGAAALNRITSWPAAAAAHGGDAGRRQFQHHVAHAALAQLLQGRGQARRRRFHRQQLRRRPAGHLQRDHAVVERDLRGAAERPAGASGKPCCSTCAL